VFDLDVNNVADNPPLSNILAGLGPGFDDGLIAGYARRVVSAVDPAIVREPPSSGVRVKGRFPRPPCQFDPTAFCKRTK